jgi:hypothetical protein
VNVASGSVTVGNVAAAPLYVKVDNGEPVSTQTQWTVPVDTSGADTVLYTVPAGKRLILDYISAQASGGSNRPVSYWLFGDVAGSPSRPARRSTSRTRATPTTRAWRCSNGSR